jgi:PST family polysaccharide transporter
MINTLVLARLLTPSDFGLIGMVTVVVNFLAMFKDAGLSTATIQVEKIEPKQISTLFWINVFISLGLGLIILAGSPLIAKFYKKPELTAVTAVLSVSFMIQGLCIQHIALLQRHLKFVSVAINDISALIMNIVVAVIMASLGFRYWALVGGTIASAITLVVMTYRSCPWLPGKIHKGTGVRNMLKFGGHLTVTSIVHYFSRNLDSLLIGRFIGAAPLGLYSKAFNLLMSPLNQIRAPLTTLSLPVLSSLRNDQSRYQSYYRQLLDISISLTLPLSVYCFLEGDFLIKLLLGQQWMNAVPVFKIFSVAGVFVAMSAAPALVMLSQGYAKRNMYLTILTASMVSISFIIGIPYGITGVAWGYTIASFLIMFPLIIFGFRGTPIRIRLILESILGPLAATVPALAAAYFIRRSAPGSGIWVHIITALVFFVVYTGITALRPRTRETIRSVIESILSGRK